MVESKSLLIGTVIGVGLAGLFFAFKLNQMLADKLLADMISNNGSAERHKQLLTALNKRNNGKATTTAKTNS